MKIFIFLGILSAALVGLYRFYALKFKVVDVPNERSSHTIVTPRGGGIAFVAVSLGWLACSSYTAQSPQLLLEFLLPGLLIAGVSLWDDHYPLSARLRFLIQIVAVSIFLYAAGVSPLQTQFGLPVLLAYPIAGLGFIWSINLFNFMDGTDGLVASQALFILMGGMILFAPVHDPLYFPLMIVLFASIFGFLLWNWPRAKIFMGDVGSTYLGFIFPALAWKGAQLYNISLGYWFLLYLIFTIDASLTLLRRIKQGHRWREPHKLHAYQRIVQYGWSHQKLLLTCCALNTTLVAILFATIKRPDWLWIACALATSILLILYGWVERKKPFV